MREISVADFVENGRLDEANDEHFAAKGLTLYLKENGSLGIAEVVKPRRKTRAKGGRQAVDLGD